MPMYLSPLLIHMTTPNLKFFTPPHRACSPNLPLLRLTIKDMKDARVRHDGFDTSVLEIHKDNVTLFMERLSDAVGAV